MRKVFLIIYVLSCSLLAQAGVHRCGTLNVRYNASGDTEEKAWDNRKAAMISVIRDSLQYDVVGLNEVTSTQLTYLKNQLGNTYTFIQRSGATNNQVLYRTSKYTCLASGTYYLAPDPTKSGKAWDAQETRWVVWAKLQDKVSGEIFFFASTHEDLYPISIREGARVAAEQINRIAGDYPCIITGDLNSEPNEHDSHAYYGKYLGNARYMSKTAPQGPYGTYIPSMNPATIDAKYLDFMYVKNVEVESYRVFNSPLPGRTLAISDHRPVVAEFTMLSPYRDFVHKVSTVEELRQVAHAIQPNDIIYLKDGMFDLGDSTLYIANTCVIEGSKNAVLTGQTQLFSLSGHNSLELKGVTIRDASCSLGVKGSIVNVYGNYLKMTNCVIESCSAVGEGLIYAEDCSTTLENCVFRGNSNIDKNAGVQIVSSLGTDLYPFVMKNCLFDGNMAYYAPALYYSSDATAYLYGNSFVNNTAEEKGALVLYAQNNSKDIRLVNNTFVNNRIDVEAGFMVEGIGGSAIWQEQAASGVLTLMHNTIVGNYTACWDAPSVSSQDFPGGALCSYAGQLALYNNIIAGNYGSKEESGDVTKTDVYSMKGIAGNVFASTDNMAIYPSKNDFVASDYAASCQSLKTLFGGNIDQQGAYHPQLQVIEGKSMPVLSPMEATYAGKNIAVVDDDARSAATVGSDILNVGTNTGILTMDQLGYMRASSSVPGAMEMGKYIPSALSQPYTDSSNLICTKVLRNGRILIQRENIQYDLMGNKQ